MTTIINTPAPASSSDSSNGGVGLIVGIFLIIVLGAGFYIFGLPAIRQMKSSSMPQINVPSQIDVNVKQTK